MVPRRAVRGRGPWSEALTGAGPSIPLPSARKKKSRHTAYCTASATSSDGWSLALTATTMYWVPSTIYVIGRPL